jgi:uncharacterized membrane protein
MKTDKTRSLKDNPKGFVVAVVVALLIASILVGVYYVLLKPTQEGYMTIYLLDSQKQAIDYPERVVNGVNSTFSVYVEVENHMGNATDCEVLVKVTQNINPTPPINVTPTETFTATVQDKETWENTATITLNQPGDYMVFFELWTRNDTVLQYREFASLSVQVL